MSTCPYCHKNTANTYLPAHLPPRDEINLVQDETSRLDALIIQTNARKKLLLRGLNAVQSTSYTLPPETLSLIFHYTIPNEPFPAEQREETDSEEYSKAVRSNQKFLLVLANVSSWWRDVVYSSPQLWARLSFRLTVDNLERCTSFMTFALQKSSDLPLSLSLAFPELVNLLPSTTFEDSLIDKLLFGQLSRVEELCLSYPSQNWSIIIPQLPQLSKLVIHTSVDHISNLGGPHLTLTLGNISTLPITKLTLDRVFIDACVILFFQCPNLIVFDAFPHTYTFESPRQPQIIQSTTFKDLKSFSWATTGSPCQWERDLFQYSHFPVLEHLKWFDRPIRPLVIGAYIPFFSRLPPTLRILELENLQTDDHISPIDIFPATLDLRELVLIRCREIFICELMGRLAEDKTFPRMRKLVLDFSVKGFSWGEVDTTVVEAVAKTLDKRMAGEAGDFCFEVIVDHAKWSGLSGAGAEMLRGLEPRLTLMRNGEHFSLLN